MTEQVNKKTDAQTTEIISDDGIRAAIDEFDDPLAPSLVDIRSALEAVQEAAENSILHSADHEEVVYRDDNVYIIDEGEIRDGLNHLLDESNITDASLRRTVHTCHSYAGRQHHDSTRWDVTYPTVIARTDS